MTKTIVSTSNAPAAIGPYSQGVTVSGGRTFYSSGQIPLDPTTGEITGADDVAAQARQVMDNLAGVLAAAEMDFDDVVRATIYLTDLSDFATVNEIYGARFQGPPPARACVQVAALPKGVNVEIDVVAVAD
ncbi:MAG: RidA family protein [Myxococcales bacterium FL481]|nr:MAG: RidA family protein [Myxococcales bacterium FL481]